MEGLAGEAGSQPGVCRCSETSPMMGSTPYGVAARRTCPSSVTSFGRVTHAPADPRARCRAIDGLITSVWGGAGEPQSGFPDGARGRGRGGAGGVLVQLFDLYVPVTMQRQGPAIPLRWRAPVPIHRQSGGLSSCAPATCTHNANCKRKYK